VDRLTTSTGETQTNRGVRRVRLAGLGDLSQDQSQVASRGQLRALGWQQHQIDYEIHSARWQSAAPGVVVFHTGPLTLDQRLWVGVLHAGDGAVLSHLTAARSAGLAWVGHEVIDVLTPKGDLVPPLPGYFFHQTRRPYERWVKACPGPPRIPCEHAALLAAERDRSVRRAIGLLAAMAQQGITTPDRLLATIPQIRKLRHKAIFTLALGDIAGGAQSFAELDLGRLCEEAGLPRPTRQTIRLDQNGRRRYLDSEWNRPARKPVVLEIDGSFHSQVTQWWKDMPRERAVVLSGSTVLRCSSIELRLAPHDVMRDLRAALE